MLLQSANWVQGYNQITTDCRPSNNSFSGSCGTVLILCNPDADALCAARILSYVLRADNIPYQLRPCGGMQKLVSILESLNLYTPTPNNGGMEGMEGMEGGGLDNDNDYTNNHHSSNQHEYEYEYSESSGNNGTSNSAIRAVILLNLGATKNLNTALYSPRPIHIPSTVASNSNDDVGTDDEDEVNEEDNIPRFKAPLISNHIKTFVLDSHRPYHLANVHAGGNIIIWNDFDHWHEEGIPSDGDGLSGDEEESEDDEEDSDDDEEDSENDEEDSDEGEAEFDDGEDDDKRTDDHNPEGNVEEERKVDRSLKRTSSAEDDDDDGDDGDASQSRLKRQRQEEPDTETEGTTDDEEDEASAGLSDNDNHMSIGNHVNDNNNSMTMAPRATTVQSIREQHQIRRTNIRKYYESGAFHSTPVSHMAYTLSTELRHASVGDLLWLACIGVSDAYLHNRLELSGYIKLSMMLQKKVKDTYVDTDYRYGDGNNDDGDRMQLLNQRLKNTFYAEDLYSGNNNDDFDGMGGESSTGPRSYNGPMTQVGFSENGRILIQKNEFRFFLLRHVSLWDAMVLSSEVNTKMQLWKNSGIKKLQEMLAKMGLPLSQCRQPYAFMKPALKRRLRSVINEHSDEYGLNNITYTGFIRVTGYKSLLSASDVAFAITALLECETKSKHGQMAEVANKDDSEETISAEEEEERSLMNSFNTAYDALNSNASSSVNVSAISSGSLGSSTGGEGGDLSSLVNGGDTSGSTGGIAGGLHLAVSLQSAIVSAAMGLVERKAITRLSHFRYAYLHATSQGANGGTNFKSGAVSSDEKSRKYNHHIFAKPLALTKLALFLMDMHRSNNKWTGTKARPLILLAEKPQTKSYLVVGYEFHEDRGNVKKNKFEKKFKLATETMQGSFKFDSFESNVIEVKSSEVQKFIEHLHYMIDAI